MLSQSSEDFAFWGGRDRALCFSDQQDRSVRLTLMGARSTRSFLAYYHATRHQDRANLSALLSSLHGRRGLADVDSFTFLRAPVAVLVINATRAADRLFRMGSDQRRQVAVWNEAVRTGFREGPRVGLPHHCCHSCFRRGSSGSTAPVARDARGGPVRRGGGVDC
jgi:hypothetical protein